MLRKVLLNEAKVVSFSIPREVKVYKRNTAGYLSAFLLEHFNFKMLYPA